MAPGTTSVGVCRQQMSTSCLWYPWLGCINTFPDANLVVGTSDMLAQCFLTGWKLAEIYVMTQVDVSIRTTTFLFQDCCTSDDEFTSGSESEQEDAGSDENILSGSESDDN